MERFSAKALDETSPEALPVIRGGMSTIRPWFFTVPQDKSIYEAAEEVGVQTCSGRVWKASAARANATCLDGEPEHRDSVLSDAEKARNDVIMTCVSRSPLGKVGAGPMRSNYPFNCWYVAATSDEVGQALLSRRLLDRPVLMYRRGSGEIVAMEDRCVHRAYPLSAGRRDGDRVVCGYHGFAYDPDGCLVAVPSQENVPPGARVRTYPVHEQSPFVWIWLGDPGAAALRPPPRVPWYADGAGWSSTTEVLRVEANYLLLHEHYLDLTDVFVTHPEVVPPDIEGLPHSTRSKSPNGPSPTPGDPAEPARRLGSRNHRASRRYGRQPTGGRHIRLTGAACPALRHRPRGWKDA